MRVCLTIFFLASFIACTAQRFGGNPPSLRWKQIDTDTARIIFPAGLDSQAQRIASIVHSLAASRPLKLGDRLSKIDIVLQNQTTIANGYVGLGPYRSEFFLNPAMNNFEEGSLPWNDLLSIHEYRHVQQFNNFNHGLSRTMQILFGEEGLALAINASIPDWFYEGDAVHHETMLSRQGRGRLPYFLNAWPAVWKAGKEYSWMKIRNGSLKNYIPNHYHLGYLLVNYGYLKYGPGFWEKVTQDASAFRGIFYPFQKAIKRYAGITYQQFIQDAFSFYRQEESRFKQRATRDSSFLLPVDERRVTNYTFGQAIGRDSMIYMKSSYDRLPSFYLRDAKGEHRLRLRDISIDDHFSVRAGRLVYAAYASDPRWGWRDYSVIKVLDLATNSQRTITGRTRYFTPDISPSGERVAAVHVGTGGKSELHVLDAADGKVMQRIRSTDILLFTAPKFIDEGQIVCAVRLTDGRSALALSDVETGATERLTPPSFNVVGFPSAGNGRIYFTASYGGKDDVYVVNLQTRQIFRVTDGTLGKYFVNASEGLLTWSVFTAEGFQLQQAKESELHLEPVESSLVEGQRVQFPVGAVESVPDASRLGSIGIREFSVRNYSKATRLFNFHSWRPYYEDPEFSFSLYGNNVLNTAAAELYYLFNENEKTHAAGANFTYGGWFPQINAGIQYTFNREATVNSIRKQWGQADASLGASIPLNWASGKFLRNLTLGSNYVYRRDFNKGASRDLFPRIEFSYLHHFLSLGQQLQSARQHIFPRFGYRLSGNLRHAITRYTSWQFLGGASIFLPGILPNHSTVITAAFQETDTATVLFSNRFPYARGYNEAYFSRMWRVSGNYHFPLVYPDWGFANILYFQRLRGNVFFDFMRVYSKDKSASADQRAVGGEIYFDTKWWNQYPLTFGFRVTRLLDDDFFDAGRTVFEVILPVSILPR